MSGVIHPASGRPDPWRRGQVLRAMVSAFLVFRLEFRKLPLTFTWEDVLAAWAHRPAIEIVLPARRHRERLAGRIDEVFPF